MCVVCRKKFSKEKLARYVCPNELKELEANAPVPDPEKNKSGRGFYLCGQALCREKFPKMVMGLMKKRKGVIR
jgi:predicted RNA-binding protein YlxR (DUF448 family)